MFITLQFPLFDRRYLLADGNRTERPQWPIPQQRDRIRYFGEILGRNKEYIGPYDDEKKYCIANPVINFSGTKAEHFFKKLHKGPYQSRIIFRRFQSDGRCLAKFEIGFNDEFENTLDTTALDKNTLSKLVYEHVRRYLLCPVKIRTGNQLSAFVPLIDAGRFLSGAYYWATTKGKKTFLQKDIQNRVEHCEPAILIQLDNERFCFTADELKEIDMPELAKEKIQLYHEFIPYKIGRYNYNLKAWMICLANNVYTNPLHKAEFRFYNDTVRYLRINLLRIHVETVIQKKFLDLLGRQQNEQVVPDQQYIIRMYTYLHKLQLNLSNIVRNKQPQVTLVQAAFKLDETYAGSETFDDVINAINYYKLWLKTLNLTDQTKQVISFLDKIMADLEEKNTDDNNGKLVFISYNHRDTATVQVLKEKLEQNNIKVILDTVSMKAGTSIEEFIGESIRSAQSTISVVSNNSLLSGWVAMETVNMLNFEKLFKGKKLIPCCLDNDFTKDDFVGNAIIRFETRLKEIAALIDRHNQNDIDSRDLNDEKSRLYFLKSNLDGIVGKLKSTLYLDIAGDNLDKSFPKILEAI